MSLITEMFRMDDELLSSDMAITKNEEEMMKMTKQTLMKSFTAFVFAGSLLGSGITVAQENQAAPAAEADDAEVLTRGPVHEAFAGTVSFNPEPGIMVDRQPPALIEEVPPEQQLEGDNVTWIPGYWAWDEDENDFLWISGIWRNLPPGRQWVPGYWAEVDGRHQWTSGYWEDETTTEVSYLPEPPKSVESGPNVEAPSVNHSWVPGNWIWRDDRYAWRTGYWAPVRENWLWTPAYYRWTFRGYVYVDGFWDYPVIRRGVVFAPIRFRNGYAYRPGYFYRPTTVISISVFVNHLFLRPNYGHYYFGDYYEPRYHNRGFYASYSYNAGRRGCDPIFAHYRWENRNVVNWERGRRDYYEFRRDHVDSRPPRTWAALNARPQGDRERGDYGVADRFDRVVGNHGQGQQRFKAVDKQNQERLVTQTKEIRKFGQERQQLEARNKMPVPATGKKQLVVSSEKINRSPVLAKKSERPEKDGGPPARLQPRASEKDGPVDKGEKTKKDPQSKNDNEDQPKRKNADGSPSDEMTKPTPEQRDKPGQRRDPESKPDEKSKPDKKNKTDSDPDPDAKPDKNRIPGKNPASDPNTPPRVKPEETKIPPSRKGDNTDKPERKKTDGPSSDERVQPGQKRDPEPTPVPKAKPDRKTQVEPTPDKKPAREPNPEPRVKQEENKNTPSPSRKVPQEQKTKAETRRVEKQPVERVRPQVTPRPPTPAVPPSVRPGRVPERQFPPATPQVNPSRKVPTQPVSPTPGGLDGEKKKRLKKDTAE